MNVHKIFSEYDFDAKRQRVSVKSRSATSKNDLDVRRFESG
jgi:hypothetical protein